MKKLIVVSLIAVAVLCSTGVAEKADADRDSSERKAVSSVDELLRQIGADGETIRGGGPREMPNLSRIIWLAAWPELAHVEPGNVTLKLQVAATSDCGDVTLEVIDAHSLEYTGSQVWNQDAEIDSVTVYDLGLVIPSGDTSGLEIVANGCGGRSDTILCYFIPDKDTIQYRSFYRRDNLTRRLSQQPGGMWHILKPAMTDTDETEHMLVQTEDEQRNLDKMRLVEQEQLTDYPVQHFWVGRQAYIRSRGERKFRKALMVHDTTMKKMQSLGEFQDHSIIGTREVLFDLRVPEHEKVILALLGDALVATERPGYYKATLDPAMWKELEHKGIIISQDRHRKDGATNDSGSSTDDESDPVSTRRNRSPSDESGDASLRYGMVLHNRLGWNVICIMT
ncbi:MAG: hypothetical protein DRP45_08335 [Candidatus Zixiibacteriota bacterium]|nr:MAG: hypothetical protein DRP45_08335 [candidate division Zixibacteria bacterium]